MLTCAMPDADEEEDDEDEEEAGEEAQIDESRVLIVCVSVDFCR